MNYGWKQLQERKGCRVADKWVFRVVVVCGMVSLFLPWGAA